MEEKQFTVKIKLPEEVHFIIESLQKQGHEAYAVGGCVRDSILGREPEDWDITTSALPQEVKKVFRKTVDTGIEHGTVTVLLPKKGAGAQTAKQRGAQENRPQVRAGKRPQAGGFVQAAGEEKMAGAVQFANTRPALCGYEVTTYRIDGDYEDGRHPQSVSFTRSLTEDLRRRDFTINAMAYSEEAGLVDEFDGLSDLENGIVRCVGDPDARFDEDALRILRALRFAAQLDFKIDGATEQAIRRHVENLGKVSKERIQTELSKLLCSARPDRAEDIFRLSMENYICETFPLAQAGIFAELRGAAERKETDAEKCGGATFFSVLPLQKKYLRYAMLCAGMQAQDTERLLRELKLDNDTIKKAAVLSKHLLWYIPAEKYALKKVMQEMTPELMRELLLLKKRFRGTACYQTACFGEDADALMQLFEEIIRRDEPVYLADLAVRGSDLIAAGVAPGPHMGEILQAMLEDVLHTPVHNSILYLLSQHVAVRGQRR